MHPMHRLDSAVAELPRRLEDLTDAEMVTAIERDARALGSAHVRLLGDPDFQPAAGTLASLLATIRRLRRDGITLQVITRCRYVRQTMHLADLGDHVADDGGDPA